MSTESAVKAVPQTTEVASHDTGAGVKVIEVAAELAETGDVRPNYTESVVQPVVDALN